ncbi:MAG: hypothetical protein AAB421_01475 [Patescibacteria group bacterium]
MGNEILVACTDITGFCIAEPYSWPAAVAVAFLVSMFSNWLAISLFGRIERQPTLSGSLIYLGVAGAALLVYAQYKAMRGVVAPEAVTLLEGVCVLVGLAAYEWRTHRQWNQMALRR